MPSKNPFELKLKDYEPCTIEGLENYKVNVKRGTLINSKDRIVGSKNPNGFVQTSIKGKTYFIHRIVYLQAHPDETIERGNDIDHKNGKRDDNRIKNLQKITHQKNLIKSAKHRDYSFTKNNHKNKKCILETRLDTNDKRLYGSLFQVAKHRHINAGSVKFICDGICKTVLSPRNNMEYTYQYIDKAKYERLKKKYKFYEKKKMTPDEFKERSKIYRETFKAKHNLE